MQQELKPSMALGEVVSFEGTECQGMQPVLAYPAQFVWGFGVVAGIDDFGRHEFTRLTEVGIEIFGRRLLQPGCSGKSSQRETHSQSPDRTWLLLLRFMKIDPEKKSALIRYIQSREGSGREILLSPEGYFDGYQEDHCTICANNREPVSTNKFSARLREIAERTDVSGVFIRFCEYGDALVDETCWIGSDSVMVVTSAQPSDVQEWFQDFEPSSVTSETDVASFDGLSPVPPGFRFVQVWWD